MLYLDNENMKEMGIDWDRTISVIEETVKCLYWNETVQPIKPYLRYKELQNRIIAMPAYVGGKIDRAGIKWIASFPDNIHKGIPRAHSVTILNEADSGVPISIINTAMLSIIRTASVSGLIIKYYKKYRELKNITIGIIGWGPIGQHHLDMCMNLLGDSISKIYIYDLKGVDNINLPAKDMKKIVVADNWQEVYLNSNIFITCTASKDRYIDIKPREGSLLLNVSLRDYKKEIFPFIKESIIVDDWEEVCRENTDIEMFHKECGLNQDSSISIKEIVCEEGMKNFSQDIPILFNPMGMAVFDIAIASYYYDFAIENNIGKIL
ncbi:2,3-diaminopropionate biosynthesis protein SbnB [Vallitalea sediminicola]